MRRAAALLAATIVVASGCTPGDGRGSAPVVETVEAGVLTACATPSAGRLVRDGGTWSGPDATVVEGVAGALDLEVDWLEVTFDELVSGVALNGGRCDLGVGGVVADDALGAVTRPTAAYAPVTRVVVAAGSDVDEVVPGQVTGVVGIEEGGAARDAGDALTAAELVEYPSVVDLERALQEGQVAAALVTLAQRERLDVEVELRSTVAVADRYVLLLPMGVDDETVELVEAALPGV